MTSPLYDADQGPVDGCVNQKGGAGKTTSVVSAAAELAGRGHQVRMIDGDEQHASVTGWLPPQWDDVAPAERYDLSHVLFGHCGIDDATWPTTVPGLFVVPSFLTLSAWENARPVGAEFALRDAIQQGGRRWDATLVDSPPNLGLVTVAVLAAIERLAIPLRASGLDFMGVVELAKTLDLVKAKLNPGLRVGAVLLCGKQASNITNLVYDQLRSDYPEAVAVQIRNTVKAGEAPFENLPLHLYAPTATATQDYADFGDLFYPQYARKAA